MIIWIKIYLRFKNKNPLFLFPLLVKVHFVPLCPYSHPLPYVQTSKASLQSSHTDLNSWKRPITSQIDDKNLTVTRTTKTWLIEWKYQLALRLKTKVWFLQGKFVEQVLHWELGGRPDGFKPTRLVVQKNSKVHCFDTNTNLGISSRIFTNMDSLFGLKFTILRCFEKIGLIHIYVRAKINQNSCGSCDDVDFATNRTLLTSIPVGGGLILFLSQIKL